VQTPEECKLSPVDVFKIRPGLNYSFIASIKYASPHRILAKQNISYYSVLNSVRLSFVRFHVIKQITTHPQANANHQTAPRLKTLSGAEHGEQHTSISPESMSLP
jgi:hypothetical protein